MSLGHEDIYNVSPEPTGAGPATAARAVDDSERDEKGPPLPPRRTSSVSEPAGDVSRSDVTYQRDAEHVMAYMVPLPVPLGPDGLRLAVPPRYMMYLPPAPDLLKPPPDGPKERKRDKWARRWQHEVRKAKTFNGAVVSLKGVYCASVRGAVYVLALLQRSELTFLSRLPRKTLRSLLLTHGDHQGDTPDERRFAEVRSEFERNRRLAKRDFCIATVLLPFATAVDIAIPIFGGFSEVDLVWMIVTGRAYMAARSVTKRFVPAPDSDASGRPQPAAGERDGTGSDSPAGSPSEALRDDESSREQGHKEKKKRLPPIELGFRASTSMNLLTQYVQAACHERNPQMFPDVGRPQGEAEVLSSIGWTPEVRDVNDQAGDTDWQIRKTTEDLRVAVAKAAKTWEKLCKKYVVDPEDTLWKEKPMFDEEEDWVYDSAAQCGEGRAQTERRGYL